MTGADSPTTTPLAVRARRVGRTYPGPPPFAALHDIDLDIAVGDLVAITGPSGSGKSTLLNLIGLLDAPTHGSIEVLGHDPSALSDAARTRCRLEEIGFIFQSFELIGHRTVTENVALPLELRGRPARAARARATAVLDEIGLAHRAGALPRHLSGGELQRTAIARALASEARLVVCDEPTGNLDTANQQVVLDLLATVHRSGATVVVVTHDDEVAAAAHRHIRLRDGRIDGTP